MTKINKKCIITVLFVEQKRMKLPIEYGLRTEFPVKVILKTNKEFGCLLKKLQRVVLK